MTTPSAHLHRIAVRCFWPSKPASYGYTIHTDVHCERIAKRARVTFTPN